MTDNNYMQVIEGSERCLNGHPITVKTPDGTPWKCGKGEPDPCYYWDEATLNRQTTTSELGELPRAVQNGMSQEEHDTWMFLSDKKALDEPYTFAVKQSDLTKFLQKYIRREQLLNEIDEKVKFYGKTAREDMFDNGKFWAYKEMQGFLRQTLNLVEENINE